MAKITVAGVLGQLFAAQISAAIFGILMLSLIIVTFALYPQGATLPRYDFIFLMALGIQVGLIATKMETWDEAKVILVFHIVGTVMEIFKTYAGSWAYPEANYIRIAGVPLFSGFMYAAVGSYIARLWRIFDFKFTKYPPFWHTVILGAAVYVNFFAHHFTYDLRLLLFAATVYLFWHTNVRMTLGAFSMPMPLLRLFVGIAVLIYAAENIATFGRAWVYPSQAAEWQMVAPAKLGSWFLLMIISWVLVSSLRRKSINQMDHSL